MNEELRSAVFRNSPGDVVAAIQKGTDPNAKDKNGYTALMSAANNGQEAVVKVMLDCERVDPNLKYKYGYTALKIASSNGYRAIAALLKEGSKKQKKKGFFYFL